jgi:cob(I)alamin adenosyltransferase
MKLYTRSGDDGSTGLFGGGRVRKDQLRVETYGTVDELNASIGLAAAACDPGSPVQRRLAEILAQLQSRLFDLGADLATPEGNEQEGKIVRIAPEHVATVETWIDEIDAGNVPLKSFILPGGTEFAARLHLARTICRRAERRAVALQWEAGTNKETIVYLNRVGDLLFAMARRANADGGVGDVPWTAETPSQ